MRHLALFLLIYLILEALFAKRGVVRRERASLERVLFPLKGHGGEEALLAFRRAPHYWAGPPFLSPPPQVLFSP